MAYTRQYTEGVGWQNSPSLATPLNATNLNKMDGGIMDVDEAVAEEFASVEQDISDLQRIVGDAVTDVTLGGTSVVDENGVAELPAYPSVPVQDVQVDDVSIVDGNGIAKLDSSNFGTPVEANPTGTASADLTKLKVGNDIYNIPSGGGGTTVVANPSGTATDDLEKIQIGNTIYDIPGSGSGGQQYTCDLLFENDPLPSPTSGSSNVERTYTLSASVENYDAVVVVGYTAHSTTDTNQICQMLILKEDYYPYSSNDWTFLLNGSAAGGNRRLTFKIVSDTQIKTIASRGASGDEPVLYKVYGLKFAATTINRPVYMSDYYDTEERVVGRWIDGKPLYQKTIHIDSPTRGSWTSVSLSDLSADKMPHLFGGYLKQWSNGSAYVPFTYYEDSSKNGTLRWRPDTGNLEYICNDSSSNTIVSADITVQYTKTTDAPGTGSTPGNIIYLPAMYSEEEHEVGVWIDGKPLYQKTFDLSSDINIGSNSWYDTGIAVQDIERCINIFAGQKGGVITNENNNVWGALGAIYNTSTNSIRILNCRPAAINLRYFTMQYTKTTDQPGGGTWTPDGQLAHHYSKSEHIIGTWIDGSTLYERTWDFGSDLSCNANAWTVTTIPNSGINLLVAADITSNNGMFRSAVQVGCDYGDYVRIRPIGDAITARYVTLQYTKA